MKNRKITTKTDREWLLQRPQNIIGTIQEIQQEGFILKDDKFVWESYKMVPAFFKIINEIIDNTVDVFIKSEGKSANKVDITITDYSVEVKDNGYGIPVVKVDSHLTGETWGPLVAWGQPRAGSNFEDDDNQGQLGMNGIGSFATVVFSKLFRGVTCDSNKKFEVEFLENLTKVNYKEPTKSSKSGTTVYFEPDLKRFGLKKIEKIYKDLIKQRLINISFSYPGLNFTFNKEKIKVNAKDYISKFGEHPTTFEGENYVVSFLPNETDDFKFFAYTNGLANPQGGSQIDYFLERVVNTKLKDRIQKRFKTIKAGDIKNKILMVVFFRNFKQAKFSGQSKEQFTSGAKEISNFLGEIDFDKMSEKIFQNKEIVNPIIELHKLKEEFEKRKALKGLEKPQKRIDSEKYTPAIGTKNVLLITEGESASGGLMPALGRKNFGYYELKGKPLNAYNSTQQQFQKNAELSLLYNIIKTEGYKYIVAATDQDLDGFSIRGLLIGFMEKYLKDDILKSSKFGILKTPIRGKIYKNKMIDWVYEIEDNNLSEKGESKYFKGIGTWKPEWLKEVIEKDGISKMIDILEYDDKAEKTIDEWLDSSNVESRKEKLRKNEFDLIKL